MESYMLHLPCGKFYVLKALERANRLSRARTFQSNIQLNGFLAGACAGIGDVGADGNLGIRRPLRFAKAVVQGSSAHLSRTCLGWSVAEVCIREPVAERKLRTVLLIDISRDIFDRTFPWRLGEVGIACGASCVQRIIVKRLLTDR